MVPPGDADQVTNSGATALLRGRLPTRSCQFHVALQHCGGPGGVPGEWPMCVGSSSHLVSKLSGIFGMHGAFEINDEILGIKPTDQSCHHEVWIHLLHVNARLLG